MYHTTYSIAGVELLSIIVYSLRCTVSPIGSGIVTLHYATFYPCILADLDRLGVEAQNICGSVNGYSLILSDFFSKTSCCLRRALNHCQLKRLVWSSLHFLWRRRKSKPSLSKPNASAVMPRAMIPKSENLFIALHRGIFPSPFTVSHQNPCVFQEFILTL